MVSRFCGETTNRQLKAHIFFPSSVTQKTQSRSDINSIAPPHLTQSTMEIWTCSSDENSKVIFGNSIEFGIQINETFEDDLLAKTRQYCLLPEVDNAFIVIVDVWNSELLDQFVQILSVPTLVRRPIIVLLSSLLTWAGKEYEAPIENVEAEFLARKPIHASFEAWTFENILWSCAKEHKFPLYILGRGLVYGREGFDFDEVMR